MSSPDASVTKKNPSIAQITKIEHVCWLDLARYKVVKAMIAMKLLAMIEIASQTCNLMSEIDASSEDLLAILAKDYVGLTEEIRSGLRPYIDQLAEIPHTQNSNLPAFTRKEAELASAKTDLILQQLKEIYIEK